MRNHSFIQCESVIAAFTKLLTAQNQRPFFPLAMGCPIYIELLFLCDPPSIFAPCTMQDMKALTKGEEYNEKQEVSGSEEETQ